MNWRGKRKSRPSLVAALHPAGHIPRQTAVSASRGINLPQRRLRVDRARRAAVRQEVGEHEAPPLAGGDLEGRAAIAVFQAVERHIGGEPDPVRPGDGLCDPVTLAPPARAQAAVVEPQA